MMTSASRHKPIEFSGSVAELAHTLGMRLDEVAGSIAGLIERGHLQPIGNGVYRMVVKPTR
jgi:hypothetical protein